MPTSRIARFVFAAALAAALAGASRADEAVGVPFGTSRATAAIAAVDGEPDADDYVAPLLIGEAISCTVKATGRGSTFLPAVQVLDPDGQDRTPALTSKLGGKSVSFSNLAADATGRWTVRISGADGTEGAYSVSFRLRAARKTRTLKGALGGEEPSAATHAFEVTRGATVSLSVVPIGKGDVSVTSVADPDDTSYAEMLLAMTTRRGVTRLKNFPVDRRSGTYRISVATTAPAVKYKLKLTVNVLPRPRGIARLKSAEPRLVVTGAPERVAAGFSVTLAGHDLAASPPVRVFVGGAEAEVEEVAEDGTSVTAVVPAIAGGSTADVTVQNPDGQSFTRGAYVHVVPKPTFADLRDLSNNPVRKGRAAGGDSLRVTGSGFDASTRVFFGTDEAAVTEVAGPGLLQVLTPAHGRGAVPVRVQDDFGRTADLPAPQFTYVLPAWGEGDGGRLPAPSATDDYRATRAAVGEFGGGRAADVVLVAPVRTKQRGIPSHGTRVSSTRLLVQAPDGSLADRTGTSVPVPGSLPFPYDLDDWNASAVAVGDVDGTQGSDLILAGFSEVTDDGFRDGFSYGQNLFVSGLRALRNDGAGRLSLAASEQPLPQRLRPAVTALDDEGGERTVLGPFADERGDATALLVGDLDGDTRPDLVVAHDDFAVRRAVQDLSHVDFSVSPPRIPTADADAFRLGTDRTLAFVSGTEIVLNRLAASGELVDLTDVAMPLSTGGDESPDGPASPGYHADDAALADVDGDEDLDLVLVWHDPVTVSVRGRDRVLQERFDGVAAPLSLDVPRIATRILLNDGSGRFTDATEARMPAGGAYEWWQADRVALTDVDGDGAPDLVLVTREPLAAWSTRALAPVAATPAGGTAGPGDLGDSETESYTFVVPADGRYVIETSLGTLPDSVLTLLAPGGGTAATDDDGGEGHGSRIDRDLTPGTWTVQVTGFSGSDTGTFTLSVRGRPATPPPVPAAGPALRILRNDRAEGRFVDVTATAVPAPPAGDDFRGGALRIGDADGDGRPDLFVATTEALTGPGGRISSLRALRGGAGGVFALDATLVPGVTLDSGEADDVHLIPAPVAGRRPSLLVVSSVKPAASQGGRFARLFDWND